MRQRRLTRHPRRLCRRSAAQLALAAALPFAPLGTGGAAFGQTAAAAPAAAAPAAAPAPAAAAFTVEPYLGRSAVAVAEVDLTRVDVDAAVAWATALLKRGGMAAKDADEAASQMAPGAALAKRTLADLAAVGVRRAYVVGMLDQQAPVAVVVPPAAGADPAAVVRALTDGKTLPKELAAGMSAEVVDGAVVWGPPAAIAAVKAARGDPGRPSRADLAGPLATLGAGGGGGPGAAGAGPAVRVVFAPPEYAKGLLSISTPNLPAELGGGSTAGAVNAFKFLSLAVDLPHAGDGGGASKDAGDPKVAGEPTAGLKLTVQARDVAGAQRLKAVVDAGFESIRRTPLAPDPGLPVPPPTPELGKLLTMATPAVVGDKLELSLDQPAIDKGVTLATPFLTIAREQAKRAQSMSNLRQLSVSLIMYANENKGRLPTKFPADLVPYLDGPQNAERVLANPRRPGVSPGYAYAAPAGAKLLSDVKDPARTIVLYETYDVWPAGGIATGFADAHSEWILDEATFKRLAGLAEKPKE